MFNYERVFGNNPDVSHQSIVAQKIFVTHLLVALHVVSENGNL